jgi:hypothetical protein
LVPIYVVAFWIVIAKLYLFKIFSRQPKNKEYNNVGAFGIGNNRGSFTLFGILKQQEK